MEKNENNQNDQENQNDVPSADGNTSETSNSPKYRVLGESGLIEDED